MVNRVLRRRSALLVLIALAASAQAFAQQKTGPGLTGDESLTWHGITLYGVIDLGVQYDTHGAPFTPYRPAASGNIVRQYSREQVIGVTPSNMGQSRVGLQGTEALNEELSGTFQIETFFNPQSGEIADSLKSLTVNNGLPLNKQSVAVDGSSAGQPFQTSYVGLKSQHFGTLTFGRQVSLLQEGVIKYDPNYNASAFGLLGASNTYSGAGSQETNRMDSTAKYLVSFDELLHFGALYKFNDSKGSADTVFQADAGAEYAGASIDAIYSKAKSAITTTSLTAAQVLELAKLGYSESNSLAATISDNTAYALLASYNLDSLKLFAGYEHIKYENPTTPLSAGFTDIGGYVLAFVNNTAYANPKEQGVYWSGVRYTILPGLDLTGAYYGVHQSAYGSAAQAGCSSTAHSVCSGDLTALSFDADYRFNVHFDVYAGAMYSKVDGGMASGYLETNNINPTIGARFKF
jgi:predicted porin